MKALLVVALLALASTSAQAGGAPWFNDQGDCKRHWADTFNGCVSRRDADNQELAGIDLRISQSESARDTAVKPKQDAAELVARLDEKRHDRQDVFLPFLTRTVELCHELHDLLVNSAAPAVANARTLIEMASISDDRPQLTPEVAAGLAINATDSLALSVILDSTLPHDGATAGDTKTVLNVHTTDVGAILERLETSIDDIDRVNQQLAGTVGRLTAENELILASERLDVATLTAALADAQTKKNQTEKTYDEALALVQTLKNRKVALPGVISDEVGCMGNASSYRDSQCPNFWYRQTTPRDPDHGHGGHGG